MFAGVDFIEFMKRWKRNKKQFEKGCKILELCYTWMEKIETKQQYGRFFNDIDLKTAVISHRQPNIIIIEGMKLNWVSC